MAVRLDQTGAGIDIAQLVTRLDEMESRLAAGDADRDNIRRRQEVDRVELALQRVRTTSLGNAAKDGLISGGSLVLKLVVKIGAKEIAFQVGKLSSVAIGKAASKTAAKVVPFVSLIAGIGFAIYRVTKWWSTGDRSELIKAAGEVVSGGVACIPGFGLAASAGLDIVLAGHDGYTCYKDGSGEVIQQRNLDQEMAYSVLGLEVPTKEAPPNKREVDQAYRALMLKFHPDKMKDVENPYVKDQLKEYAKLINACKEFVFKENHWQ